MIDSILDRATSILERRFLTNAFLPVLLLLPAIALPTLAQGTRQDELIAWWDPRPLATKAVLVVAYFTACWFAAAIVASQWRNIIRLYEGYPLARIPWLYGVGRSWHQKVAGELNRRENDRHWFSVYENYPTPDEALPTRLGNVMRAAERYPLDRYNAELILIWPRLQRVVPPDAAKAVEDSRATLEFLLVLSLWCTAFGVLAPVVAYGGGGSPMIALACFVVGGGGAYASYLSAIGAAAEYGELLRALFDIHRLELLSRLQVSAPRTYAEERDRWGALGAFIGRNHPPTWTYGPGVVPDAGVSTDVSSSSDGDGST